MSNMWQIWCDAEYGWNHCPIATALCVLKGETYSYFLSWGHSGEISLSDRNKAATKADLYSREEKGYQTCALWVYLGDNHSLSILCFGVTRTGNWGKSLLMGTWTAVNIFGSAQCNKTKLGYKDLARREAAFKKSINTYTALWSRALPSSAPIQRQEKLPWDVQKHIKAIILWVTKFRANSFFFLSLWTFLFIKHETNPVLVPRKQGQPFCKKGRGNWFQEKSKQR